MTEQSHTERMMNQINKVYKELDASKTEKPLVAKNTVERASKRIAAVREDREVYKAKVNSAAYKQKFKDFKLEY